MFPKWVLGQILLAPASASALPLTDELLESWIRDTQVMEKFEPFVRQFTSEPVAEEIVEAYFKDVSRTSNLGKSNDFQSHAGSDLRLPGPCVRDGWVIPTGATR